MADNGAHSFTEGSEEWRASPKPKKPLAERLDSLSDKIISAKAMFQVAMEAEQEVTALKKELQQQKYDNENAWKGVKEVCAQKYELEIELKQRDEAIKQLTSDFGKVRYSFQQMNSRLMNDIIEYKEQIQQLRGALKEERNKAIDECMREIERLNDDGVLYESTARKVLEFLKSYSS